MSIQANLEEIRMAKHYAIPKEYYRDGLSESFADAAIDTPEYWLIPCSHTFHSPATEAQIAALEANLGLKLSGQLQDFLRVSNGAELYNLHYQPLGFDDYWIARYRVLNCSELLGVNHSLLDTFLSYAEFDEECRDVEKLNYIAFCDVGDGNYLALNLEGVNDEKVFFLDHDYGFYPFDNELAEEGYTHVASSLDEWLKNLAQTNGWDGMGGRFIPL